MNDPENKNYCIDIKYKSMDNMDDQHFDCDFIMLEYCNISVGANSLRGKASDRGQQGREVVNPAHGVRKEVYAFKALAKVLLESISFAADSVVNCKKCQKFLSFLYVCPLQGKFPASPIERWSLFP